MRYSVGVLLPMAISTSQSAAGQGVLCLTRGKRSPSVRPDMYNYRLSDRSPAHRGWHNIVEKGSANAHLSGIPAHKAKLRLLASVGVLCLILSCCS